MNRFTALGLAAVAAVVVAVVLLTDGGGDGDSSENAQQVVNETFSGKKKIESGRLDISLDVSAEGDNGGSFEAKLTGPFQSEGEGKIPQLDLDASVNGSGSGQNVSFEGGITTTGDQGFVSYKGTDYEVPRTTFDQFRGQFESQAKTAERQRQQNRDVKPGEWLTNLKNEGTEEVNGASTIHISGEGDVERVVEDFKKIAEQAGTANLPPGASVPQAAQIEQLKDSVKEARFDIYTGEEDRIIRRLDANLSVENAGSSADIRFSFGIADLNEPQEITAPAKTKPLAELISSLGLGGFPLGGLGGGDSGGGSSTAPPGGAGGQPGAGPGSDQSQKYLDCLQKAKDQAAIQQCASQLTQ